MLLWWFTLCSAVKPLYSMITRILLSVLVLSLASDKTDLASSDLR